MGIVTKGNILLDGTIHIPAEFVNEAMELLKDHIRLSRAEPGCLSFDVTKDPEHPGRFVVSEAFEDQATFDAHQRRVKSSVWGAFTKEFLRIYETKTME